MRIINESHMLSVPSHWVILCIFFAVLYNIYHILYMFCIVAGRHIEHISLNFSPVFENGVSCTTNRIFVATLFPAGINIYTWKGVHIQTLSHQDLGLERSNTINALQCTTNGALLHLAVGKLVCRSLHAYRVSIRIYII